MNHNRHPYLMIGLVAVGAVLFLSGSTGGGLVFLLWPLACLGMMFFMMRSMGGLGARKTGPEDGQEKDRPAPGEYDARERRARR